MAEAGLGGAFVPSADYTTSGDWNFLGDLTVHGTLTPADYTFANPVITGTVTGAATYSTPVLTAATITTSLVPTTNNGAALGDTTHQFADLFLAEGGVINWDNGDATLTQVSNMVTLAGADLTVPYIVASGDVKGATFHVGASAGASTTGSWTSITAITVTNGIVVAITGS